MQFLRNFFLKNRQIFLSAAIGLAAFILIYGIEPLRYTGTGWMLHGFQGNDITQHQTGWEFYRRSPWTFPLCKALFLGYPEGTAISYTDSIPIAALFFKIISPILPESFQYFGMYTCLSFILQAVFACMLLYHFTGNRIYAVIGSTAFVTSSCFLERCFRHTALSSHWLILATLLLYFHCRNSNRSKRNAIKWAGLLCLSIGIHPYLFAMNFGIFMLYETEKFIRSRNSSPIIETVFCLASVIIFGAILGLFETGLSPAVGFGIYSLNLNALLNPHSRHIEKWSLFMPSRPIYAGQADGMYYIGLGIFILMFIVLADMLLFSRKKIFGTIKNNIGLLILCGVYTIYALSNIIAFDDKVLIHYYLPSWLIDKLNVFRASGRFFFVPYYCIFLFVFVKTYKMFDEHKFISYWLITAVIIFQTIEIYPGIEQLHNFFEKRKEELFLATDWKEIAERYDTALSFDCLTDRTLAFWLSENNFKTNMMITAPVHMDAYWERTKNDRENMFNGLRNGEYRLDPNTIYIISEATGYNCTFENEGDLVAYVDDVRDAYKGRAELLYLTDWVKNYWVVCPL